MRQPIRRKNIRRTIAALRSGQTLHAPLASRRWSSWVAGTTARARNPVKSPQDLVRRKGPAGKMPQDRMCRIPKSPAPPPLPARQCRYERKSGPGTGLGSLAEAQARRGAANPLGARR